MSVKGDFAAAVPLFLRATQLDPNFAMAYARLGTNYFNMGQDTRAIESTRKAYELRERASEREKLYITSHYQDYLTRNTEAARTTYELWPARIRGTMSLRPTLGFCTRFSGTLTKLWSLLGTQ
jgi:tetratricopeptide (TPR) repeat protein